MNIILSRHGNTFGPNDPVVWTGATNDLPLVEKGLAQAEKFAAALLASGIKPAMVYCSPLQRTSRYGAIVVERLGLPFAPKVDPRINEVDYGEWTGLTNAQVVERYGVKALGDWDERSQWPSQGGWGGSAEAVTKEVQSFVHDLRGRHKADETVVVVTSNGRLRYFLTLVEGEFEKRVKDGSIKVKTGNICKLTCADGVISIPFWNIEPVSAALS